MELNVKTDIDKLIWRLNKVQGKQLPYAFATALTRTAEDARLQVIRELPHRFTIRNRYVTGGLRKTAATKSTLRAEVGSITPFMDLQEVGGQKTPKRGKNVAVASAVRPSFADKVPLSKLPSRLLAKKNTFAGTIHGHKGIWTRPDKHKGNNQPTLMYALAPQAHIKKHWGFEASVERTAQQRIQRHFVLALRQAFETAR